MPNSSASQPASTPPLALRRSSTPTTPPGAAAAAVNATILPPLEAQPATAAVKEASPAKASSSWSPTSAPTTETKFGAHLSALPTITDTATTLTSWPKAKSLVTMSSSTLSPSLAPVRLLRIGRLVFAMVKQTPTLLLLE